MGSGVQDLSDVLTKEELSQVVLRALGPGWTFSEAPARPASQGLTGFLGDHFRTALRAIHGSGQERSIQLFVKCLPLANKDKAEFIDSGNYFRREMLMYSLFEEFGGDEGPHQWRPRVYLCTDRVLVMPDLAIEGFASRPCLATLDLAPSLAVAASTARMHAAFADYATRRSTPTLPYDFLAEHGDLITEPTFCDSPWLRAAAKLSVAFLAAFSSRPEDLQPDLETRLHSSYLEACDSLRDYPETINVALHKDLWINNILFSDDRAVIVDYQCVRYAPPAFDPLMQLYLTTTRGFRDAHEKEVLLHYYSVFMKSVSAETQSRLKEIGYDREEYLRWCERARMFGLFFAIGIFPYVLMEPEAAKRHFDDPATFEEYVNVDRSRPVLEQARVCPQYRQRQLAVIQEYVDRYLLGTCKTKAK